MKYVLNNNGSASLIQEKPKKKKEEPVISSTRQPKVNPVVAVAKTAGNVATNMGTGALKTVEGVADTVSDLITNPIERNVNYAYDYITKGKKVADANVKDLAKMQERDIKRNLTQEFQDMTGYTDVKDKWENGSLIKSNNVLG